MKVSIREDVVLAVVIEARSARIATANPLFMLASPNGQLEFGSHRYLAMYTYLLNRGRIAVSLRICIRPGVEKREHQGNDKQSDLRIDSHEVQK